MLENKQAIESSAASEVEITEEAVALSASYNNRGFLFEREGRILEARREFELAIGLNPANASALNNLGRLMLADKDIEPAIALLLRAINCDPSLAPARNNLGNALLSAGKPGEALDEFRAALALDPSSASAQLNLAQTLHALGELPRARAAYERFLELSPHDCRGLTQFGVLLATQSEFPAAVQCFEAALRTDSTLTSAWVNLAFVQLACRNFGISIDSCKRALELCPDLQHARYVRALSLLACGETVAALEDLEYLVELEPGFSEAAANLGVVYLSLRRFDEAGRIFRSLLDDYPNSAQHHYHLAAALHGLGQESDAIHEYEACVNLAEPNCEISGQARRVLALLVSRESRVAPVT